MKVLSKASDAADKAVRAVVFLMLVVMVGVVSAAVFWRYVLNDSLSWAEELARYLLVWISFLGASIATHDKGHISISTLTDLFPPKIQRVVLVLVDLLIVVFLAAVCYHGIKLLPLMRFRLAPTLFVRMDLVYLVLPISSAIMILHLFAQSVATLRVGREAR